MRVIRTLAATISIIGCSLFVLSPALAQVDGDGNPDVSAAADVDVSVDVAPPPLPVYDQPPMPDDGYLWVPGYWAWDDATGYYWVPGTWVQPPQPELLWTPGYWGWGDGVYLFHPGYWGPTIGFYGGVAYGFGYNGIGYEGGYWRGGAFYYNRTVNNFGGRPIVNVYSRPVIIENRTNVSFNGGAGGIVARPTPEQLAAARERHIAPTTAQIQHRQEASRDPSLSLNNNHGHPAVAATAQPGVFKGTGVIAAHPGQPVAAVPPQGHRAVNRGNAVTTPGGNKIAPQNTPSQTFERKGNVGGPPPGTGNKALGTDVRERKGTGAGTPPGTNVQTQGKKLQSGGGQPPPKPTPSAPKPQPSLSAPKPPPPAARRPPPPPPPAARRPPPPPTPAKKCPPGQRC